MERKALHIATFPSELGWMAAVGRGKSLAQLVFGYRSPQQAVKALASRTSDDVQDDSGGEVWSPPWIALLQAYARGEAVNLLKIDVELGPLTPFQQCVLDGCRRIPYGQTMTYGELAAWAGLPRAARAVGNCMAHNRIPLVIPCHRVVPAGGRLGGYSAADGVRTKLRLLEAEAAGPIRLYVPKRMRAAV